MKSEALKRTETTPYRTFEDLDAYKAARAFRKMMYAVARKLPEVEKFGLVRFHFLDQIKFCLQARGSLEELLDDVNVCEDEQYLPDAEIEGLKQEGWRVHKVLNGYIRFLRSRIPEAPPRVREDADDHDWIDISAKGESA
jgi:hypothetical protein